MTAAALMKNIVRKPACLRVLQNVLKGVSINPHCLSVVDCGLKPFSLLEETRALYWAGNVDDDDGDKKRVGLKQIHIKLSKVFLVSSCARCNILILSFESSFVSDEETLIRVKLSKELATSNELPYLLLNGA
ncbi:jg5456 [Pararge aegeria aegeria]|uniref:Jg5456 protein n=1 Tax=Pararge aegeria aegeria TaxID=348720 RepID=A0A8S4SFK2_9NEOP|nr:jg5456 [Pararge aegeria aegeria]